MKVRKETMHFRKPNKVFQCRSFFKEEKPDEAFFLKQLRAARTLLSAGISFYDQGDLAASMKFLDEALEYANPFAPGLGYKNEKVVACALIYKGHILSERKEHRRTLECYQAAWILSKGFTGEDWYKYTEIALDCMGAAEEDLGNVNAALQHYADRLDLQLKFLGELHEDTAYTYYIIGRVYLKNQMYFEGLDFFEKALRIQRQVFGEKHFRVAVSLNDLAKAQQGAGMHERSMESYLECLKIRQAIIGESHSSLGGTYHNIGTIHRDRGDDDQAIQMFQHALKLKRTALDEKRDADVALTLQAMAWVYMQQYQNVKALESYTVLLGIQRRGMNTEEWSQSRDVARTLCNMANVYLQSGETENAMKYIIEAARIMRRSGESESVQGQVIKFGGLRLYGFSALHPASAAAA